MTSLKKIYLVVCLCFLAVNLALGQGFNRVSTSQDLGIIYNLPAPKGELKGTYYLDEDWKETSVRLSSNSPVPNLPMRLDLRANGLEVKTDDGIKFINNSMIKEFAWKNNRLDSSKYINTSHYFSSDNDNRIMEELVYGQIGLYKYHETFIEKANYNPALDVGSKDDVVKLKAMYYFSKDDELYKISSKLKKNQGFFGSDFDKVKSFMKENKLKMNNDEDLKRIAIFANTL